MQYTSTSRGAPRSIPTSGGKSTANAGVRPTVLPGPRVTLANVIPPTGTNEPQGVRGGVNHGTVGA